MLNNLANQKGVTLLLTLIMLVVMTLSVIALVRSTDTTNLIAGNVAFQQGATYSAQQGVEAGVQWLENIHTTNPSALWADSPANAANGFYATIITPTAATYPNNWWDWWPKNSGSANQMPADAAGNVVSYIIERLCFKQGNPQAIVGSCENPPLSSASVANGGGDSQATDSVHLLPVGPVYFRITAHVQGAKNTQSLVQAIVSK